MKSYLFLCLVSFLFILILIYLYDRRELVISRVYKDNNIYIEYPYFNNKYLDNYINDYIVNYISNTSYKYNYYVKYKYSIDDNNMLLTISDYKYVDNIYNINNSCFNIDIIDKTIFRVSCVNNLQ